MAEIEGDVALVQSLLEEQHPDLAGLPVRRLASGWDNVIFHLGDELVVRLPQRSSAVALVEHEIRWLPDLARGLPLPVPVPLRVGVPGRGYPWPWWIGPWLPGDSAEASLPDDLDEAAEVLGRFLAALHRPAPPDAPSNPYRGVPLADRAELFERGLHQLAEGVDRERVAAAWEVRLSTPAWAGAALWLHGDVHPLNLLVHRGRLSGVIDFGDLTAGDPASDLAIAWMLFPPGPRGRFRSALGRVVPVDDDTWLRAHGWALALGVALANGDDRVAGIGYRTLRAALADNP